MKALGSLRFNTIFRKASRHQCQRMGVDFHVNEGIRQAFALNVVE